KESMAAMPTLMREMGERDRKAAKAQGARSGAVEDEAAWEEGTNELPAMVHAPAPPRKQTWTLDMNDDDLDVDQMFDDITDGGGSKVEKLDPMVGEAPNAAPLPSTARQTAL